MAHRKRKILLINGHPVKDSYNAALAQSYYDSAVKTGAEIQQIAISDLNFDPNLPYGYSRKTILEPDLVDAQQKILWADHLVWIHPLWWGGLPAMLKGFIDRVFLPGFAFQLKKDSLWWDKLLVGKTSRIISTMDQPYWWYWLVNGKAAIHQLKKNTLDYCGISPVRVTTIGPIKRSTEQFRAKGLKKVEEIARKESLKKIKMV